MFTHTPKPSKHPLLLTLLFSFSLFLTACGGAGDSGGDESKTEETVNDDVVVDNNIPLISSVFPSTVLSAGVEAKISGFDFNNATVTLNGSTITPTVQNDHEIRFINKFFGAVSGDFLVC